jgi:hypothetical protein
MLLFQCEEAFIFSLETLSCSIPVSVTFAFPERSGLEVRTILYRRTSFIGTCTLRVKKDLESNVLYLNKMDLAAVEIGTEINHILGEGTIGYSTVTCYLLKQSFADYRTLPLTTVWRARWHIN